MFQTKILVAFHKYAFHKYFTGADEDDGKDEDEDHDDDNHDDGDEGPRNPRGIKSTNPSRLSLLNVIMASE